MNSYPPELLAQLAPVMFVAGLDVPSNTGNQPPGTPQSPSSSNKISDPFHILIVRLREALTSQRKVAIWQPEKSKTFHAALVDKEVRFPPRKLIAPDDPSYASSHSPLSPLTPSSPLHPDGLIAPIWMRKHTTLIPSVFVMFTRLYEHPPNAPKSPLEGLYMDREKEREAEEKRHDAELSTEIANRKKNTNERNIKLTVVLLASRKMLGEDEEICSRVCIHQDFRWPCLGCEVDIHQATQWPGLTGSTLRTEPGKSSWTRGVCQKVGLC